MTMPDELYISCAAGLVDAAYRDKETLAADWRRMWPDYTAEELNAILTAPEGESEIYRCRMVKPVHAGAIYQAQDGRFFRVWDDWDKNGAATGGKVQPAGLATAGQGYYIWFIQQTEAPACQEQLDKACIADELAIPYADAGGTHLTNYLDGRKFETLEAAEQAVREHFKIYGHDPYRNYDNRVLKTFYVRER